MSKRRSTPLFEMLGESRAVPGRPTPAPAAKPKPKPRAEPRPDPRPRDPSRPPGASDIRLSPLAASITAAVVLVTLVLAWTIAYSAGYRAAENELLTSAPPLAEQPEPVPVEVVPPRPPGSRTTPPPIDQSRPTTRPAQTPQILVGPNMAPEDPRVPGTNYLAVATLPREDAEAALAFLATRGQPAIATLSLDRGRSASNDSPRYRVIATGLAVPSGRYSAMRNDRDRFERTIKSIGRSWLTEHAGASDFSSPQWERFDP